MENLQTTTCFVSLAGRNEPFEVRESDHGDQVVLDVFREDHYLLTLAPDGSILFMNFGASEKEREIFKLPMLEKLIERLV